MNKKLILLLVLIFIISIFPLRSRLQLENTHKNVEIIMDGREFQEIELSTSEISWNSLAEMGVTGASLPAFTLEDLVDLGRAARWSPAELEALDSDLISDISRDELKINSGGAVFYFPEELNSILNQDIIGAWEELYDVSSLSRNGGEVIYFPNWDEELEDLMPGFDKNLLEQISEAGLRPAARLKNQPDFELNKILLEQISTLGLESVIFAGDEVAGFAANIKETAQIMKENDLIYGYIEPFLADQEGADQLARNYNQNVIRLHSMQQEEMDKNSLAEIRDRYLRAAQERNVRYLYLRGMSAAESFSERGKRQEQLAGMIASDLQAEGFSLQPSNPLRGETTGEGIVLLAAILVFFAGYLCVEKISSFISHNLSKILLGFWLAAGAVLMLFYFNLDSAFYRQFLALTTAIIFPVLSGFKIVDMMLDEKKAVTGLLSAIFIGLGGGLLVAVILGTDLFFNQVYVFRGVKIAFILPLIGTGAYYFLRDFEKQNINSLKNLIDKLWQQPLKWGHVIVLFMAGIFLLVYIGRTGNLPFLPVPAWEIAIRNNLEEFLSVRPRFKEFFIGHPFLLLIPFIKRYIKVESFKLAAVLMAVIGQITVINSFSHLHTPLSVTLQRTFHGYWLALPIALIFGALIWAAEKLITKDLSAFIMKDEN